ncbi:MAG: ABC transporter ATP-binding protein [Candidatus Altiarchaeota archaeon]
MSEHAIITRGLGKRYHASRKLGFRGLFKRQYKTALRGVDLKVGVGECFGVLGPNGSGKTTLIKILSTLTMPSEGTASVGGFNVVSQDWKVRQHAALVYMNQRSFYWRLTGRQNLEFFGSLYNIPSRKLGRRINEVFELVELSELGDERITSYSSGMKSRLAIARGLLPDTPVLFMDEPTVELDPRATRRMRDFIREKLVREAGKTVFLATNDIKEAEDVCNRVAILRRGEVVAVGSPEEISETDGSLEDAFIKLTREGIT